MKYLQIRKLFMRSLTVLFVERRVPEFIKKFFNNNRLREILDMPSLVTYELGLVFTQKTEDLVNTTDKIDFVYFSCKTHFNYLLVSLKSLNMLNSYRTGNVYICADKTDFFSESQIEELHETGLNIKVIKVASIFGWGIGFALTELKAFKKLLKSTASKYVMKVDSDVIFISDQIFKEVIDQPCVGHPNPNGLGFQTMQGGGYFLSRRCIHQITNMHISKVIFEQFRVFEIIAEDVLITDLCKRTNNEPAYVIFQAFFESPKHRLEGNESNKLNFKILDSRKFSSIKNKYSIVHFYGCKDLMEQFYEKYLIPY